MSFVPRSEVVVRDCVKESRMRGSEENAARSAIRIEGWESMLPRRLMRRPASSVVICQEVGA